MAILLLLSSLSFLQSSASETDPTIAVTADKTEAYSPGDTVTFTVSLNNNPGILISDLYYSVTDEALAYKNFATGDLYSDWYMDVYGGQITARSYASYTPVAEDGAMLSLSYTIDEGAADGEYTFAIGPYSYTDRGGNPAVSPSYVTGDIDKEVYKAKSFTEVSGSCTITVGDGGGGPGDAAPFYVQSNETGYDTLPDALDAAGASDTITLAGTYTIDSTVTIPGEKTITLTGVDSDAKIVRAGGFTGALISLGPASNTTSSGVLTLSNITIDGNGEAVTASAPLIALSRYGTSTLNIEDGAVLRNNKNSSASASSQGGAILLYYNANNTLNFKGGAITQNTSKKGGGINAYKGTVNITGGNITDNTCTGTSAAESGGGVFLTNSAVFQMTGGKIENNNKESDVTNGEGIYFGLSGAGYSASVGGGADIKDESYLAGEVALKITSSLMNKLKIDAAQAGGHVSEGSLFATGDGYTLTSSDAAKFIWNGADEWYFKLDGNQIKLTAAKPPGDPDPPAGALNVYSNYGGAHGEAGGVYTFTPETGFVLDVVCVDGVPYDAEHVLGADTYSIDTNDDAFADAKSIVATYAYAVNFNFPGNVALCVIRADATTKSGLANGDIIRPGDVVYVEAAGGYDFTALTVNGLDVLADVNDGAYSYTVGEQGEKRLDLDGKSVARLGAYISAAVAETAPPTTLYKINVNPSVYGTATADKTEAAAGETVTVTVTPKSTNIVAENGVKVTSDGVQIPVTKTAESGTYPYTYTCTFEMPERNVLVAVTYEGKMFDIASYYGGHGSVTADKASENSGVITLTVAPDEGYHLVTGSVKYKYVGVTNGYEYTLTPTEQEDGTFRFTMPGGDVTIEAEFAPNLSSELWTGAGTAGDPYAITTVEGLVDLRAMVNAGDPFKDVYFLLGADLDLTEVDEFGYILFTVFRGTFDGGGHTLTVKTNGVESAGPPNGCLFLELKGATLKNLTLEGTMWVVSEGAAFAAEADSNSLIENCVNRANVGARSGVAGIVFSCDGIVKNCVNYGMISCSRGSSAGIVARSTGTVSGCRNYGTVISGAGVSGIAGTSYIVEDCANYSDLGGTAGAGITLSPAVGANISGCYNTGAIVGAYGNGGIAGRVSASVRITDCYNLGSVTGDGKAQFRSNAGGIAGDIIGNGVVIENCYNAGIVTVPTQYADAAGAIIGDVAGHFSSSGTKAYAVTITNSHYLEGSAPVGHGNNDVGNTGTVTGTGEAKTAAELRGLAGTLGGAFIADPDGGYPVLAWQASNADNTLKATQPINENGVVTSTVRGTEVYPTANDDGSRTVTLNVTAVGAVSEVVITLRGSALNAVRESGAAFALATDLGKLTFDAVSLSELAAAADGGDAVLTIKRAESPYAAEGAPVFELSLTKAGGGILPEGKGEGTVSAELPYERIDDTNRVSVYRIEIDGEKADMKAEYSSYDKAVAFDTDARPLYSATVPATYSIEEEAKPQGGTSPGDIPETIGADVWDGKSIDVRWYNTEDTTFTIGKPAELAGLAAIVNGIYNENGTVVGDDDGTIVVDRTDTGDSGEGNLSTDTYHYGADSFAGKTVLLAADINMGSANYMPIGGQYLMQPGDDTTKISSSFNGTFDGQGHTVTVNCDRWTRYYGDGSSVGLIGRLGVHDDDPAKIRPYNPTVKNVAVDGYIKGNRSVGGIVGKIGKTSVNNNDGSTGGVIEDCANLATIVGTDAKGTGGIVGSAWNGGAVRNCYNAGDVANTGAWPVGGIAGSNEITIENCYNIGQISSPSASLAMGIGRDNGGAPYGTHVINSYSLAGKAPGGGYYDNAAQNSGVRDEADMLSDGFVVLLGDAFVKDTRGVNGGFPIFAWQDKAPPVGAPASGDADGDGKVTAADALLVAHNIVSGAPLTAEQRLAADLDGDGVLTMADAIKLMRKVLGL